MLANAHRGARCSLCEVERHDSRWSGVTRLIGIVACASSVFAACASAGTSTDASVGSSTTEAVKAEESTVDVDGGVVRIRVVGPVDATDTLIAIHGGPGLSLEAMAVFENLANPDRRVVSYDQRGAGRSTVPDDLDYSLDAHVADLEAVRDALGADTVQLVGQSWGGAIAAAYAATHPDRVSALVLVGAVPLDRAEYLAGQQRFQARVVELQQLDMIDDDIPPIERGSCLAAFEAVLPAYLDDPTSDTPVTVTSCNAATSRATYETFIADESVSDYADRLATFTSPALLLAGESDIFGPDWLTRHRELLAGAPTDTVLIPDAGHLVTAEQPDATLSAIEAFLRDHG